MYGTNTGRIRADLATLLRQQRTSPQADWTTATLDIHKFRQSVLVWCRQAVGAANPPLLSTGRASQGRGPVEELRHRLDHAIAQSSSGAAGLDELAKKHRSETAKTWQRAARTATLGEHDFGAGVNYVSLELPQCMTVLKDASEIVHAIVILDAQYALAPEWKPLPEAARLGRAAVVCAAYAGYGGEDHTVDSFGWRRRPTSIPGRAKPGVDGVLQAQHNVAVDLADHFPNALNLRRVINFQRELSELLAERLGDESRWTRRASTLRTIEQEARNLGGQIGSGGTAAAESANAARRLARLPKGTSIDPGQAQRLERLAEQIDSLLASAIVHGAGERLYFLRAKLPRLDDQSHGLVHGVTQRYVPIRWSRKSQLLETTKTQLRPPGQEPVPRTNAPTERVLFQAELEHRPQAGPALEM